MKRDLLTPIRPGQAPKRFRNIPQRYQRSWAYKDGENNFFLGLMNAIEVNPHSTDKLYVLEGKDVGRPDLLAYKFYKDPSLYWVLLWINQITDPFEGMYAGMVMRIPTIQRLAELGVI